MGFTLPTRDLVYDPVRQWLEYEFIGILTKVRGDLLLAKGQDSDWVHPGLWESEARRDEATAYEHASADADPVQRERDRLQAWDDAYKLSP